MPDKPTLAVLRKIKITLYKLTTESHMTIGAGEAVLDLRPVDKPIIRALIYDKDNNGKRIPYIPASSLHGVWRSWVEKVIRSSKGSLQFPEIEKALAELKKKEGLFPTLEKALRDELGMDSGAGAVEIIKLAKAIADNLPVYKEVCDLFSATDCCEDLTPNDLKRRPLAAAKSAWKEQLALQRPCKVCRLFGHTGQRGRVRFTAAYPAVGDPEHLPVDIITRVAINRITGAADDGKLFDLEAVPPQVPFYFFTLLENPEEGEEHIFEYGFKALNTCLATLGAHASVGYGAVRLEKQFSATITPELFNNAIEKLSIDTLKINFSLPSGFAPEYYPTFFVTIQPKKS
jgi:CRISPR/Cas system CSM-associated protein Csm3 (group 7 of RAMP superfamily)